MDQYVSRRAVLAAGALGLLSACGASPVKPVPTPNGLQRIRYGAAASQYAELTRPAGTSRGVVVVLHGGYWSDTYGLELGRPLSADLVKDGWTTWNVEYRRLGDDGGWPATFSDVAAAIDHLASIDGLDTSVLITLGHSAGGTLAVQAASRVAPKVAVTAAISQAGVLDLATGAELGLGGGAVEALLGGPPSEKESVYAKADPMALLPSGIPVRCLHSKADNLVPFAQSQSYVDAAVAAGDDATLIVVPGDHFAHINPDSETWAKTKEVLTALAG